ncbi:MAG: Radical domain protein [Rhodospirillales bacterium]|nr:Radical domain protein [Rhodospirillales bacterium]
MPDLPTLHPTGPLFVLGGPYGNLDATRAALDEAGRRGVRDLLCTGDLVAYCADAAETVALLRASGAAIVAGNVERQLAAEAEDCGCGFEEGSACDALSARWWQHARAMIDRDTRAWMGTLPDRIDVQWAHTRFSAIHGGAREISKFLFASTDDPTFAAELDLLGTDGVIAGHCGLPFVRELFDGRVWLNAGAVGLPANDGTPRVWCAQLTPQGEGIEIETIALDYDPAPAAARMRQAALPEAYAEALTSGLWPSLDILPAAERAATGHPIKPLRRVY